MTKVLIADDHGIVRAGLRALIGAESGFELVGEASGGYEAISLVEQTRPDVMVLDLSMPGVRVGNRSSIRRAIVDENVVVPPDMSIGCDHDLDRRHFVITEGGVVVVPEGTVLV